MKRFVLAFLLLPTVALAQQPPSLQADIDGGEAQVTRVVTGFGNKIAQDAARMDQMQRQIVALQKQVADMKAADAKAGDAKPAADAPATPH